MPSGDTTPGPGHDVQCVACTSLDYASLCRATDYFTSFASAFASNKFFFRLGDRAKSHTVSLCHQNFVPCITAVARSCDDVANAAAWARGAAASAECVYLGRRAAFMASGPEASVVRGGRGGGGGRGERRKEGSERWRLAGGQGDRQTPRPADRQMAP